MVSAWQEGSHCNGHLVAAANVDFDDRLGFLTIERKLTAFVPCPDEKVSGVGKAWRHLQAHVSMLLLGADLPGIVPISGRHQVQHINMQGKMLATLTHYNPIWQLRIILLSMMRISHQHFWRCMFHRPAEAAGGYNCRLQACRFSWRHQGPHDSSTSRLEHLHCQLKRL